MKNVDNLTLGVIKGGVVDIPLALAEGFRNTPRLWGQSVKEQQEITGWSSGAVVAGKVRTSRVCAGIITNHSIVSRQHLL